MICSSCLQDVPDLIGPAHDLCPACYGVEAEDYIPWLHDPPREAPPVEREPTLAEPWYLEELLQGIEADLAGELDGDLLLDPPCFRGRRRF